MESPRAPLDTALKIGWISGEQSAATRLRRGGQSEEDWLKRQFSDLGHEIIEISGKDLAHPIGLDRVISFCETRVELPELLESVGECCLPAAIASSSWHLGAGRTGLRETATPVIPWYRFWDGWLNWLELDLNNIYPVPPRHLHSLAPPKWAAIPNSTGLIVTGEAAIREAWIEVASELEQQTTAVLWSELEAAGAEYDADLPDWILWDDSCLDTCAQFASSDESSPRNIAQREQQLGVLMQLSETTPSLPLFAATIHPHWQTWEQLDALGALAIIAKPDSGVALCRVLSHFLPSSATANVGR